MKDRRNDRPLPGLVLVFSADRPALSLLELPRGGRELGREVAGLLADRHVSRRHARVRHAADAFYVEDLGSQNGTFIDGRPHAGAGAAAGQVLRMGSSLLLLVPDLHLYEGQGMHVQQGRVTGPQLGAAHAVIAGFARTSQTLHIHGESGTGKEAAARAFHKGGPHASGSFVAVNCASIPEGVAERLLFGALRGTYSGADSDSQGYVQAAHGGVLFLDEVGELSPAVQAKLLRVLESREVLSLGAARPRPVDLRLCSATHRDLRELVGADRLRADLYFRIATPSVRLPALRERLADIPFLIAEEVARCAPGLQIHVSFVEACLLRPWPGNVRELLAEVRAAAQQALMANRKRLYGSFLSANAGAPLCPEAGSEEPACAPPAAPMADDPSLRIRAAALSEALRNSNGNVSAAAAALGMHRTQLRRWLARCGIAPAAARNSGP